MARKRKKKGEKRTQLDPYEVLEEKVPVTALELIRLIHRVNPTNTEWDVKKASERYRLKARLQSLLIRRFKESLQVEIPDPENPRLVGLRLLRFNEDACHAMIHELEDDAGSWVRRRIDEAPTEKAGDSGDVQETPGSSDPLSADSLSRDIGAEERDVDLTVDEWISLGKKALDAYDYEACERYYMHALKASSGGLEPALCVLELLVEHLAAYEKALDVSALFSAAAGKDQRVRILLGLSSAHCGHFEQALDYIDRISDPRVVDIRLLVAEHFIKEGDENRAAKTLSNLKSHENVERKPAIDRLEQKFLSLRAGKLEHVEKEMILAWEDGRSDVALELAERILSLLPRNKAAQQVRRGFEKQQRQDKIVQLLLDADDARGRNVYRREADLLKKAIALGANARELSQRLKYARNMAEKQRDEMETADLLRLWEEGRAGESLLQFMGFSKKQRRRIVQATHDPHFRWAEEALSSDSAMNCKKVVDSILTLGRSKKGLEKGENIDRIIQEMTLHCKVLQSVPEARTVLEQAESILRAMDSRKNKDLLEKAGQFLTEGHRDLEKASHCLSGIKVRRLDETDREYIEDLRSRLQRLEAIQMLRQKYDSCSARGDHFICMDMAEKLAEQEEEGQSNHWRDKVREHAEILKKAWPLVSCDIRGLPASYGSFGMKWMTEEPNCWLLPDGRHVVMVTSHGRWVFVRTFCLDDQKFRDGIILRAPEKLPYPNVVVAKEMLWIAGQDAHVLGLCLDPVTIKSWYEFSSSVKEDEVVEHALIFPEKGTLWLDKRNIEKGDEIIQVIDMEQERTIRKIKCFHLPVVINRGGRFEVAIPDRDENAVSICSEEGRTIVTFEFEKRCSVDWAVLHPNGVDYVFLTYDNKGVPNLFEDFADEDDDQYCDFILTLKTKPDVKQRNGSTKIEDSHGELLHVMAASRDTGIIFVYFATDSGLDTGFNLAAFRPSGRGFDLLYQVTAPEHLILFSDECSDRVAAIIPRNKKMQAMVLDDRPPRFDDVDDSKGQEYFFPSFDSIWHCDVQTGAFNAEVLAQMLILKDCSYEVFYRHLREIKLSNDPDRMASFISATERLFRMEESKKLSMRMQERYPDHCRVLLDRAKGAAKKQDWREVISLLERISPADLDGGSTCHRCHLLGMAYFVEGDSKNALRVWKEGARYEEGQCDLDPYITYARLSLMNEKQRKKCKMRKDMRRGLDLYETVNRYLKAKDWHEVIATVESADALETKDLQLMARLTQAYLHQEVVPGDMRFFCKVLVLANYCEQYDDLFFRGNRILPHYIEMWSEDRLKRTANEASEWLGGLCGQVSETGSND